MSLESEDREVIGLEFRIPSISITKVFSYSNVNKLSLITLLKGCLKRFTVASHNPPKCRAASGMKCHTIWHLLANLFITALCSSELSSIYISFNWLLLHEIHIIIRINMLQHSSPRDALLPKSLPRTSRSSRCAFIVIYTKHTRVLLFALDCGITFL